MLPLSLPRSNRATGFAEFSPFRRLLWWPIFPKYLHKSPNIFSLLFSQKQLLSINFDKVWLGLCFGQLYSKKHRVTLATTPSQKSRASLFFFFFREFLGVN
jgi:hypothetical protein